MGVLEQVRTTIAQHKLFSPGDGVVVGVSGGADSLTLLHCLRALRDELQITLHVAHLNHQLRGKESDADAEFVAWLAHEWNLPATLHTFDVAALAREQRLSIEEAARHMRYAFLADVAHQAGARVIAVAHHADDQVETVLMHLLRGAGLAGLRGMQYKIEMANPGSPIKYYVSRIVRPLLDVTRAEIEAYCKRNYLAPRQDSSNLDTTLFRNRLRHEALPYLETLNPNLRQVLLRSSRVVADDYDFLQAEIDAALAAVARQADGAVVFKRERWRLLHPAIQRGTLRTAVRQLRGDLRDLDWTPIEDARRIALEKGTGAAATLPQGLMLFVGYEDFTIADAARGTPLPDQPLLNADRIDLPVEGMTTLPGSNWVVQTEVTLERETDDRWTALLDFDKCFGELYLRPRRTGDRFHPAGLQGHSKSLHEFMIDEKIPQAARERLPLLCVGEWIAWVCGFRVDERARVTAETRRMWRVTFKKKENV